MGYGIGMFTYLINLGEQGILLPQCKVLELGAQEINDDVPSDVIIQFIRRFNPDFSSASAAEILLSLPGGFVGKVYEAAGFMYRSIDLVEGYRSFLLDLNHEDLPEEYRGQFDFVTNIGTTEHVCNQMNAFQVIHDALKPNGYAIHQVPFTGYFNHGLIKYEPRFFIIMAHENNYSIVSWCINAPHAVEKLSELNAIPGSSNYRDIDIPSAIISFLLRKNVNKPFVTPTDVDLRHIERDFSADQRAAIGQPCPYPYPTITNSGDCVLNLMHEHLDSCDATERIIGFCQKFRLGIEPYLFAFKSYGDRFAVPVMDIDFNQDDICMVLDRLIKEIFMQSKAEWKEAIELEFGRPFIGTGWGMAESEGAGLKRKWRWLGPQKKSSLFIDLDPRNTYQIRTLLHDAKPGPIVYHLSSSVHGQLLDEQAIKNEGDDWWHLAKLPARLVQEYQGKMDLSYGIDMDGSIDKSSMISLRKVFIAPL